MSLGGFLVQLDPDTGRVRWHANIPDITRMFHAGDRLWVCAGGRVHAIDFETGRYVGAAAVGFAIRAGVCDGERLVVAGPMHAACVDRNGTVVWSARTESSGGIVSTQHCLVARDRNGAELWRTEAVTMHFPDAGLLLGDAVAQPDLSQ